MPNFYFTYGSDEKYPFQGGWTKVTARSINVALSIFRAYHPNRNDCLNCADYYTEDEFKKTSMYKDGNYGHYMHEHINMEVNIYD